MPWVYRILLAGCAACTAAGPVTAADRYYVTIFTAETVPFRSKQTHTFVAAVRVPGPKPGPPCPVEVVHISWFPATLVQRGLTPEPEPGVNLGLAETFADCGVREMRVSCWGPYEIAPELFEVVKCQAAKLMSGKVMYKPTDILFDPDEAVNCYHAIWAPLAPGRKVSGPFNCGDVSGGVTVKVFDPWLIDPCRTHDEVLPFVVPDGEKLYRRAYDDRPKRRHAVRSMIGRR